MINVDLSLIMPSSYTLMQRKQVLGVFNGSSRSCKPPHRASLLGTIASEKVDLGY